MAYLTKVVIDSVTVRDDDSTENKVIQWEYERTSEVVISQLTMKLLSSVNNLITLIPGKSVEVWTGFTNSDDLKVFSGFISEVNPNGGIIELVCKDKMWDLVRRNVNTVYETSGPQSGVISDIAKDLIETYGGLTANVQSTGTLDTEKIAEFRCDNTDIWERLIALAKAVDFHIFYDAVNDTVHFEPKGFADSGETLTVGNEIIGVPKWINDTSRMVNDLRVDGAVSLTQIRLPSGTGVGQIDVTTDFDTDGITLTKTPENVELIMDAGTPPTEVKTGGTKDSTIGNFYYVDRQNKTVKPASGTSFTASHYAVINYTWLAPSPIHQISQDSIEKYGLFEKQITLEDIQTVADAEVRTSQILSTLSIPFEVGELRVKQSSTITLGVGNKVVVVDGISQPNINKEYVITKQVLKYPGANQEITVGDETLRLADWQINVEERLKRIEEQLSLKNQDLILELRDFFNTVTFSPRYRKITTKNIGGDTLVWGNPDFGTWNAYKWGSTSEASFILGHSAAGVLGASPLGSKSSEEVDHFVEQYQNSYEEDFIDSDFKNTDNTDCTWANDGSITFTSGQIAESLSIDYNNAIITTAKLTSTEVSGSFDYEMTADGTNWESVTSGVTHVFTDTGTDLRWRATENNTSTGEIGQIKVEEFH